MNKRILFCLAAAVLVFAAALIAGTSAYRRYAANAGFTPWMSIEEQRAFLQPLDAKQPGVGNFWDNGHWITAVEGRWHQGLPQYRLRIGDAPKNQPYRWSWNSDLDSQAFNKKLHEFADQGFTLVSWNAFQWPDGSTRYQGVWHKLGKQK